MNPAQCYGSPEFHFLYSPIAVSGMPQLTAQVDQVPSGMFCLMIALIQCLTGQPGSRSLSRRRHLDLADDAEPAGPLEDAAEREVAVPPEELLRVQRELVLHLRGGGRE